MKQHLNLIWEFMKKATKESNYSKNVVYVGNLNYSLDEEDLTKMFSHYGQVLKVNIVPKEDGKRKGIAFIQMKNQKGASLAIRALDGKIVAGRTLKVSVANDRFRNTKEVEPSEEKQLNVARLKSISADSIKSKKEKTKKNEKFGLAVLFSNLRKIKKSPKA